MLANPYCLRCQIFTRDQMELVKFLVNALACAGNFLRKL